ncbi:DUF3488 and transglutaminase-like domain-containing protein [Microbacterium sp. NPDC089189]|uniref:transglutaminase family protein n=1 Tax=Microbacterium sp. NPDC089189 TaxID=3154972 RepID=UPI0034338A82
MSARERSGGQAALAVGIFVALIATTLPVLRVVGPGWWVASGLGLAAVLLTIGVVLRRIGVAPLGATAIEFVLWVFGVTAMFFGPSAYAGFVPSPTTLSAMWAAIGGAVQEMAVGAAPLEPTPALSFFVVASIGALTVVLDHVVLTTRMPLLGAVALVAVALVPAIAVPAPMDVFAFALLAASILFLLRTDTRTRAGRSAPRSAGTTVSAIGIAAVALTVAVVVTPLLPAPDTRSSTIGGVGNTGINPTLRLGDDLRRPNPVEVLRVHTSDARAPYLRAVTLSSFVGDVWRPDQRESTPVDGGDGFGPVGARGDVALNEADTHVEIEQLDTAFLPVPFPATEITGLTGNWGIVPDNRTVVGADTFTGGQSYEVITQAPRPSLEQIRAATSRGANVDPQLRDIPDGTPEIIAETAREITAEATNDYDAAAALQRWFRSSEFSYSLRAPVDDGFDGAGVDAIAQFLEVREGYCVHFASAFAVMTRSLDMPTRIVIGYLPGMGTDERVDDRLVYSVTSDLLHSWPEVYFEGIGWVPFEPTNSLGVATVFTTATGSATDRPDQAPADQPEPTASTAPTERPDTPDAPQAGSQNAGGGVGALWPATLAVLLGLAVLAAPAVAREVVRRRTLAAAGTGDESAAWRFVQTAAIDLGIPVPPSESPRAFGARLIALGAPAEAMQALVGAIEHASYAPTGAVAVGRTRGGRSLVSAAAAVRAGLGAASPPARRTLALLAPRSLVVRPGTDAAGAGSGAAARAR